MDVFSVYNVGKIRVADDIFGLNRQWTDEFCEMYSREIKLPLQVIVRVDRVDVSLKENLKKAGCVHIFAGVESGDDFIRNSVMKRNLSKQQIINAFSLFNKYKIKSSASYIIGMPGETTRTVWESIRLNRLLKPTKSRANIFYPYAGTKLGDYCLNNGLVNKYDLDRFHERKESVLKFSKRFKKKLIYFHSNWHYLSNITGIKYVCAKFFPYIYEKLQLTWRRLNNSGQVQKEYKGCS